MIPIPVRSDSKSLATLWSLSESPYVHFEEAVFFTFLETIFCMITCKKCRLVNNTFYERFRYFFTNRNVESIVVFPLILYLYPRSKPASVT